MSRRFPAMARDDSSAQSGRLPSGPGKPIPVRTIACAAFFVAGAALGVIGARRILSARNTSSELMAVVAGTPITRDQFIHQMEIQEGGSVLSPMIADEM